MSYQSSAYDPIDTDKNTAVATTDVAFITPKPETFANSFVRNALYLVTILNITFTLTSLMTPFLAYDATLASNTLVTPVLQGKNTYGGFGPIYWRNCVFYPDIDQVAACFFYGENDAPNVAASAKAFKAAGISSAFFLFWQFIFCFVIMELINPDLKISIGFFIADAERRMRLSVTLILAQACTALLALVFFFSCMSGGGFTGLDFLREVIATDPTATYEWLTKDSYLTLGPAGALTLIQILLLPPVWWFLRKRLM